MKGTVLIVDDDPAMRRSLVDDLESAGFSTREAGDASAALALLERETFDALVTDVRMPGRTGLQLCAEVTRQWRELPVVVITGFGGTEVAVEAMRAGAYDFLAKPFDVDVLVLTLERAVGHKRLVDEVKRLSDEGAGARLGVLGESEAVRRALDMVRRVADLDVSVLVTGETGTGKEVFARALHEGSRRRSGPFVALNCTAVPEALLESQLFGHVKGAFTDARVAHKGLFLEAQGGTLFLDEIGHMPLALQPKLLRALQERMVRPVGAAAEIPFDARVVTATNVDLEQAVEEGTFREDLFYRINVVQVSLPPLRARGNDVLLLAHHFLERAAASMRKAFVPRLSSSAAEKLLAYAWPGNVRELQNCMERAVALVEGEQIEAADLPDRVRMHTPARGLFAGGDENEPLSLEEVERRYILHMFETCGHNRGRTADVLKVDRKTLYRKLLRYGIATRQDEA